MAAPVNECTQEGVLRLTAIMSIGQRKRDAWAAYDSHIAGCKKCQDWIDRVRATVEAWEYPADMDKRLSTLEQERTARLERQAGERSIDA